MALVSDFTHPTCADRYMSSGAICYARGVQATICGGRGSSAKSVGNKANEISIQSVDDIEKPDAAVGTNGPQYRAINNGLFKYQRNRFTKI